MLSSQKTESAVLRNGVWILSRMGEGLPAERVIAGVAEELETVQRQGVDAWGKFGDGLIERPDPEFSMAVVSRRRRPTVFRRVIRFCRAERRLIFLRTVAAETQKIVAAVPSGSRDRLLRAAKRLESIAENDESAKRDLRMCLTAIFAAKAAEIADSVFRDDDGGNFVVGGDFADLFGALAPAAGCMVNFCDLTWWKPEYGVSTIAPDDSALRREARDARKNGDDLYLVHAPFARLH